jgi:uncharacterized caspase-like protein
MFRLSSKVAVVLGLLGLMLPGAALAERRVALVVGNSEYRNVAVLPNTVNDAQAIAALLKKAGFEIVEARQNLGVVDFKRALREFMMQAERADIAVVYYAGHGIEAAGNNYLIPVDARLASDYDAEDEAISLERVVQALQPAQRLRLVILDACRDNPFTPKMHRTVAVRAVASGLAKVEPLTTDTLIAYAAKAGSVSYDGSGPNSPFTAALLKYLAEPGVDIRIALGRVRDEVMKVTERRQEPFVYGSLGGATVALVAAPDAKSDEQPAWMRDPNAVARRDYELAERIGTRAAWESFLAVHGTGLYADLARAQLAKLAAAAAAEEEKRRGERDAAAAAERQKAEREAALEAERQAQARQEEERRKAEEAAAKPQREAAARATAQGDPAQQEAACKRDAERLERLRADPVPEEVAKLAREMTCERLRPQVMRLLESVAPGLAVAPAPPAEGTPDRADTGKPEAKPAEREAAVQPRAADPDPAKREAACKRDQERLTRLRANPVRDEVERFAREFSCEALRPQVMRLLESVGG